jgi:hypothetical protein
MFSEKDKQFDQMAADPVRRREGIAELSQRRNLTFWVTLILTGCALVTFYCSGNNTSGAVPAALSFGAALQWMAFFRYESELKLLRVIDKLQATNR